MTVILQPNETARKFISKQNVKPDTEYRMSRHVLERSCDNGRLLYNTLTGKLVLLNNGEIGPQDRNALIEDRFFVPVSFDENKYVDEIRNVIACFRRSSETVTHYTILTTTDCNARCFYCYEAGTRRFSMTEQTAADIVRYIEKKHCGKPVKISWFGGEPLKNIEAIDIISAGLAERGIEFTSTMTSNGFYLTPEFSQKAADLWHLEMVQITIDGTKDVYCRTKAYVDDCPDPFGRVLDNIDKALEAGIRISVRLNMDAQNAGDLLELADVLADRFSGRKGINAHVQVLREVAGRIHKFNSVNQLTDSYWELTDKICKLGIGRLAPLQHVLRINSCMADDTGNEVILPDGRIARCEHVDENETVASIYQDTYDNARIDGWKERITYPECKECPMYPMCICLKKCEWAEAGCLEQTRLIWIERTKRQMLEKYNSFINNDQ